ncbi:glycosyltransferase family 2 protein [bacterium]|nr:glycosyltransferase family 2 protein [bacterium]
MPAYNAAATLARTVSDIPPGTADEIILVDDASSDDTVKIARELGLTVIVHEKNVGYGGNQKTCYRAALDAGADVVIMIHPDYQYDSALAPHMIRFVADGYFDIMLGSRIRTRREALEGGMPVYKYVSNRFLTIAENVALGQNLGEYHTGYRCYSRKVLETIDWLNNSDDFVFDTQFLVQAVHHGFRIAEIPVPVRYMAEASSINFRRSMRYGLETLWTLARYFAHRWGLRRDPLFAPAQAARADVERQAS